MSAKKETSPRLGRGLAALLGDMAVQAPPVAGTIRQVPIDLLEPNPFQPRTTMDAGALEELAQSIRAQGILQPLLVRPHPAAPDRFQIVAGERRWRAAGAAGLHEVPALVRDMADTDAAAVALVENLQRQDLNPIDEAEGYDRLLSQFGLTQEALGQAVGKSRSHVTNILRLLNLPPAVKQAVRNGRYIGRPRPRPAGAFRAGSGNAGGDREAAIGPPDRSPGDARDRHPRHSHYEPRHGPDAMALEHMLADRLGLGCGSLSMASRE